MAMQLSSLRQTQTASSPANWRVVSSGMFWGGVRSPLSHLRSSRPYGDASVAGLTNLLNQVQRPHAINAARNLPAPQLLLLSVPPQKFAVLFMPSPCILHSVFEERASAALHVRKPMHKTDLNHQGPPRTNRCSHSNIEIRNVFLARNNLDFVAASVMPASLAISFIEASDR
jgi:hypothetical protein